MKKSSLKRLLALLMAGTMMASFAACDTDTDADTDTDTDTDADTSTDTDSDTFNMDGDILLNEPGEYPLVQDGQDVTLSVWCSPHLDTCQEFDAESNVATAWYEEKTNVNFDWTIVSSADKTTKLNLVFTDTDYPDMIWGSYWDGASQVAYSEAGFIVPLTEYYEGGDAYWYDYYIEDAYEVDNGTVSDAILASMVMPDGEIYSMFNFSPAYHTKVSYKMWIYEPWLEAVGMEEPTTTEEYYEVLTAFKNEDPNGNGKEDEIPLTGSPSGWNTNPVSFLMNSFVQYGDTLQRYSSVDADGQVIFTPVQEGFRTGLEYLAQLDDEGLLITDTWTQDATSLKALTTGDVNLVGSAPGGSIGSITVVYDREEGDWTNWTALDPLEGPDGIGYSLYQPGFPTAMFQITDQCEYPKIAFRVGDSMYDIEVALSMRTGLEGEFWEYAEEGDVGLDGEQGYYVNLGSDANTMAENYSWGQLNHMSTMAAWHTGMVVDTDPSIYNEAILYNESVGYWDAAIDESYILPTLIFGADVSTTVIDIKKVLDDYLLAGIPNMIINGVTDESWDSWIADLTASGYEELMGYYQDSYDVYLSNLNAE